VNTGGQIRITKSRGLGDGSGSERRRGKDMARLISSVGYGILGFYQGAFVAFYLSGALFGHVSGERWMIISAILGAVIGGYLGSKANRRWKKGCVISGAIIISIFNGLVAAMML
jgi:hypothetical protein